MDFVKKHLRKIIYIVVFSLSILYFGNAFLTMISNNVAYKQNDDAVALGNRVIELAKSISIGEIYWCMQLLLIVLSVGIGFVLVRLIDKHDTGRSSISFIFVHLWLYGVIFASYGKFYTDYTDFGFEGIDLSFVNQFLIILIEFLGCWLCDYVWKRKELLIPYFMKGRKIFFTLVTMYIAFAFVGKSLFMSTPYVAWDFSMIHIAIYFLFCIWLMPFELGILLFLEQKRSLKSASDSWTKRKLLLSVAASVLGVFVIYLIAYNPGNMQVDAVGAVSEISNRTQELGTSFPIMIKKFYRIVFLLCDSPVIITICQMILMDGLIVYISNFFYNKGISGKRIWCIATFFAAFPTSGIFTVTFSSNFYYTIACVWMTVVLIELANESKWKSKIRYIIELFGAGIMMFYTRNEGQIVILLLAIVGLFIFLFQHKKRVAIITFIVLGGLLALFLGIFARPYMKKSLAGANTVCMDAIMAVAYYNGDLPETIHYENDLKSNYKEYEVQQLPNNIWIDSTADNLLYCIGNDLDIMFRNRLDKAESVWNVTEAVGAHNAREIISIAENNLGIERKDNILTRLISYVLYPLTIGICILDILCYRSGIYLVIGLILSFYLYCHDRKYIITLLPAFGHGFILLLSLMWQCSRHTYCIILSIGVLLLYILFGQNEREKA